MARLYHLTCLAHFRKIFVEDEFLKTTESNIGSPSMFQARKDDPIYNDDMVSVWTKTIRPRMDEGKSILVHEEPRKPMIVPGEVLRRMEEHTEIWPRINQEDFAALEAEDPSKEIEVAVCLEFKPDPDAKPTLFGEHVGPDVVWLTCDPTATQDWQSADMVPVRARKDSVLFIVDVPDEDIHKWSEWAFEQGISQYWYDALDNDEGEAANWFVVDREIPKSEWVAVYMAKGGEVIWLNPEQYPDVPAEAYEKKTGLIRPDWEERLRPLHPKPEVFFASRLMRHV